jgi:hypothetical protein
MEGQHEVTVLMTAALPMSMMRCCISLIVGVRTRKVEPAGGNCDSLDVTIISTSGAYAPLAPPVLGW